MAKIACCYNCVFAFLDLEHTLKCYEVGILNWPACAKRTKASGGRTHDAKRKTTPRRVTGPKSRDTNAKGKRGRRPRPA